LTHLPAPLHPFKHGLIGTLALQSSPDPASAAMCAPSFQKHLQKAPLCPAKQKPRPEQRFGHVCNGTMRSRDSGCTRCPRASASHARPQSGIPGGSSRRGLYFTTGELTSSSGLLGSLML
jgi:hypothetical protein